jgi:hypothetical protein
MDLLGQRKQAVLSQLASLSAIAEQTASSFPDLDDLDDFDAEHGDRTITMPPQPPALPPETRSQDQPLPDSDTGRDQGDPQQGGSTAPDRPDQREQGVEEGSEAAIKTRELAPVAESSSEQSEQSQQAGDTAGPAQSQTATDESDDAGLEIDGDATIMVPASQLPAGTAHLRNGAGS